MYKIRAIFRNSVRQEKIFLILSEQFFDQQSTIQSHISVFRFAEIRAKKSVLRYFSLILRNMDNLFQWTTQDVDFPDIDTTLTEQWLDKVAQSHRKILGPMTYIFCSDKRILEVNKEFLNHDYYTDIITFDYTHGRRVSGDVFISLDTVRSNAESLQTPYSQELRRVIVHGLLHLCGIDDKAPGQRAIMEHHENEALKLSCSLITM